MAHSHYATRHCLNRRLFTDHANNSWLFCVRRACHSGGHMRGGRRNDPFRNWAQPHRQPPRITPPPPLPSTNERPPLDLAQYSTTMRRANTFRRCKRAETRLSNASRFRRRPHVAPRLFLLPPKRAGTGQWKQAGSDSGNSDLLEMCHPVGLPLVHRPLRMGDWGGRGGQTRTICGARCLRSHRLRAVPQHLVQMTHHTFEHRTNVKIVDGEVLSRVSPWALAGHAVSAGWVKTGTYGQHSDIYEGKGRDCPSWSYREPDIWGITPMWCRN